MNNPESIKIGLWQTTSKNQNVYHKAGKPVEISGKRFWVSLFKNNSDNPKAPEFQIVLNLADDNQGFENNQNNSGPDSEEDSVPF